MSDSPVIEVTSLTKRYAGHTAVSGMTFSVGSGEVVGLLGPNGAGKTTTMRILSGYMPATSGTVRVGGYDVFTQSDEARRRIGYMPENNPLHVDMRVRDYLRFRARLKGLSRPQTADRVDTVMEQCGLEEVGRKIVGHLSKGFRQRVGLADALVHEPELVILDEPTIGLDPHQIRSVRQLIKGLAQERTVLISTHILSEAEMTCSRVMILHEGRMLASDTTQKLQALVGSGTQVVAEILAPEADLRLCWEQMAEVEQWDISAAEGSYWRCALTAGPDLDLRPVVFEEVRRRGWSLRELRRTRVSLEDVFVRLTRSGEEEGEDF